MKYRILVTAICIGVASAASAQQMWERNFGGAAEDFGEFVRQTSDTGYILAGSNESFAAGSRVYLVKTNALGDTLWTRTYGPGGGEEWGYCVRQCTDNSFVAVGFARPEGRNAAVYLVKTDASGDTQWTRTFGGTGDYFGYSVQQTRDGGYVVAGMTRTPADSGQVYLLKTNASGDTQWTRSYGGPGYERARSIEQTLDGGYIVVGFGGNRQVYLLKTDALGDTLWTRTYGSADYNWGNSVQQTSDTGYILAGGTTTSGYLEQVYLIKTNPSGDTIWTHTYGEGELIAEGSSVEQTSDGGYVVAGTTDTSETDDQVYLIWTNARGDTLWTRTYGGPNDDRGYCVQQTLDRGYIIAGWTNSFGNSYQACLIKTDSIGRLGIAETPKYEARATNSAATIVRGLLHLAPSAVGRQPSAALLDASGRKVLKLKPGPNDVGRLAPGVYFVRTGPSAVGRLQSAVHKVVIQH